MSDEKLSLAELAARTGGEILQRHAGNVQVSYKADASHNLVTQADLESEAAIVQLITERFPSHKILGEEGGGAEGDAEVDLGAEHLWIIDPLDGTTNYAHGIPQYCTAVGYAEAGKMQAAAIWDPCREEMFAATRGGGARLNGQPIKVSQKPSLEQSVVATGFYYDRGEVMQRTLRAIEQLFARNIRGIRRLGSAALDQCWVACGRWEAFFEYRLAPWDYAASSLIVEEAGGDCFDREGRELKLGSHNLIATNGLVSEELMDVVGWSK